MCLPTKKVLLDQSYTSNPPFQRQTVDIFFSFFFSLTQNTYEFQYLGFLAKLFFVTTFLCSQFGKNF